MNKFKWLVLLIIIILNSGCFQYRELDALAIVNTLGIDRIKDKYLISIHVINTRKQHQNIEAGDEAAATLYEATGDTLQEAINNITLECPKELYLGHIDVIMVGEETARTGIKDYIDFLLREREMRKIYPFIIVKGATANAALKVLPPVEILPGTNIINMIQNTERINGIISNHRFDRILKFLYTQGRDASLTAIEVIPPLMDDTTTDNLTEIKPAIQLKITGPAIMKGDKLIGFFTKKEGLSFNLIRRRIKNAIITFPCDNKNNYASVQIDKPKVTFKTEIKQNKPKAKIELKLVASLTEYNCTLDLKQSKNITKIEKMINKEVKTMIKDTITTLQTKYNADVIGFGEKLYRNNFKEWQKIEQDWATLFPTLETKVTVNSHINSIGSTLNPAKMGGKDDDY